MLNIGVIGLGAMGQTHLDAYGKIKNARVIAVADSSKELLEGKAKAHGNIKGQAQHSFDYSAVKKYEDAVKLINDPQVQAVDICLPTPAHLRFALMAVRAGKHVILEKPVTRYSEQVWQIIEVAGRQNVMVMPAHCMRFWPEWVWLKETIDRKTYGKVFSAHFERLASHPGRGYTLHGEASGGALFDVHLHDTDFITYCFGLPEKVSSNGYSKVTDAIDHIFTHYDFGKYGPMITAEGAWNMADGFPFQMRYRVNFEDATALFDINAEKKLMLFQKGIEPKVISCANEMGYLYELQYFVDSVLQRRPFEQVTMLDAANTTAILEAEDISCQKNGEPVTVAYRKLRPFKIGIMSDSFKLSPLEGMKVSKSVGAQGIQIYAVKGEISPETLNKPARQALKDFISQCNLEIAALCGDLGGHGFERADENVEKIHRSKAIVDLASDLGTKVVTTHIGVVPSDSHSEIYQNQLAACRELANYASSKGVTFAIETGPEEAVTLKSFLDDVATPGIGVNLDPANFVMVTGDDPVKAVFTLRNYIVHTHAKDGIKLGSCDPVKVYAAFAEHDIAGFDFGTLFNEVPLGEGSVRWDEYLDALEIVGYRGFLTIEREVGENPVADIREAVRFLQRKIQTK